MAEDWSADALFEDSEVDVLLAEENPSLREILKQDDLIQEVRSRNATLLEFLSLHDTISQLVDTVVVAVPSDAPDSAVAYRLPYMATEVLSMLLKIPAASDELVGRHVKGSKGTTWPHLRKVFGVFRRPGPVASYLLGYCNKLVRAVCEQRPVAMRLLLNDSPSILSGVLAHCYSDAVVDIIDAFMSLPFHGPVGRLQRSGVGFATEQLVVVPLRVLCSPSSDEYVVEGVAKALCRVLTTGGTALNMQHLVSKDTEAPSTTHMRSSLLTAEFAAALVDSPGVAEMLVTSALRLDSPLCLGPLRVLQAALGVVFSAWGRGRACHLQRATEKHFDAMVDVLMAAVRHSNKPFGRARLAVLRLVIATVTHNHRIPHEAAVRTLASLMFAFPTHSVLLTTLASFFGTASETLPHIVHCFVVNCEFHHQLASSIPTLRPGDTSCGPLHSAANALIAVQGRRHVEQWKDIAAELDQDQAWLALLRGPMCAINVRRAAVMGGVHPDSMGLHKPQGDDAEVDAG